METTTKPDGTKGETTTAKDGSTSKTTTNPNGSSVTENKAADGSTGTVAAYIDTARRIKKHPIADRKLKKITPDHLQSYLDLLSLGGE